MIHVSPEYRVATHGAGRSSRVEWCELSRLRSGHHLEIGGRAGVYRIRAVDAEGHPVPIARAKATDPQGILHIGESMNLGIRIRTFRQAAEGLSAPHHATVEFKHREFAEKFPLENPRFDYALGAAARSDGA